MKLTKKIMDKKEIDNILCIRYMEGYSEYDKQYKDIIKKFITIQKQLELFKEMQDILGEFNAITKKVYEDIITQWYKKKYNINLSMEELYTVITNISNDARL